MSGKITLQLLEALSSSLDMSSVLREAYPLLTRLVPADYGAVGVSSSGKPADLKWAVAEMPATFFAAYPEMAAHDFVHAAVVKTPNRVLLDQEMVSRVELEQNMMYRRAREVGAPIEQVMAVMLHVDDRWHGGLSLYRDRPRPFSATERARLQRITPALASAVKNCHLFALAADWKLALERLLADGSAAILLASSDAFEVARTDGASPLLEKWFARHERRGARLPEPLARTLEAVALAGTPTVFRKSSAEASLEVEFLPLTGHFGAAGWMLRFEERGTVSVLPESFRARLTPREQQVTIGVLDGWDNRLIGQELGCAEATVKKHLQRIFEKLGVESRTALVARATGRVRVSRARV